MARQLLNVGLAVEMALESQVGWLLHIDIDELFYCPRRLVKEHFQSLDRRGILRAVYRNHEAVPETTELVDYFRGSHSLQNEPLDREPCSAISS